MKQRTNNHLCYSNAAARYYGIVEIVGILIDPSTIARARNYWKVLKCNLTVWIGQPLRGCGVYPSTRGY